VEVTGDAVFSGTITSSERLAATVEEISVVRVAEIGDQTWFDGNRLFSKINVNM
jgi:hypothetical protein